MNWPHWDVEVALSRPAVRVNQLGYLPHGPKQATLVRELTEPVTFTVWGDDGSAKLTGRSQPWLQRPEQTSGLSVHVLDFTDLGEGERMQIEADGRRSHPFDVRPGLYGQLRHDALRFFNLMRSGTPISAETALGYERPAGHLGERPNRGDTAVPAWTGPDAERLYAGWRGEGVFDVSGGWYDAGDYGKYVTSGSIAAWQLLSTIEILGPTTSRHNEAEFADRIVAECRWQLDWLLRMQVPVGHEYAGLAFHRVHGVEWSPLPGLPHEDPTERVLHRPSTPAGLHLAAVTAHAARLLEHRDPAYARRLLVAAEAAYAAVRRHPGLVPPDDHARFGGGPYNDDELGDDFYWAAAELWLTTGRSDYRRDLQACADHASNAFDTAGFDFNQVAALARIDLALCGRPLDDHDAVKASVLVGADRLLDVASGHPWGQAYAPAEGWDWGSNGRLLNNLVVLAIAHLLTGDRRYFNGVASGMDYLLGRNALGHSYITGYGTDYSHHQRTRQFGHDLDPTLPPPPPGALAGGANSQPAPDFPYDPRLIGLPPQCCYLDEPTSEVANDVCIRWNAPLVWISTYLDLNYNEANEGRTNSVW